MKFGQDSQPMKENCNEGSYMLVPPLDYLSLGLDLVMQGTDEEGTLNLKRGRNDMPRKY